MFYLRAHTLSPIVLYFRSNNIQITTPQFEKTFRINLMTIPAPKLSLISCQYLASNLTEKVLTNITITFEI